MEKGRVSPFRTEKWAPRQKGPFRRLGGLVQIDLYDEFRTVRNVFVVTDELDVLERS